MYRYFFSYTFLTENSDLRHFGNIVRNLNSRIKDGGDLTYIENAIESDLKGFASKVPIVENSVIILFYTEMK